MAKAKRYDPEYIKQAIKLAKEIGTTKAEKSLEFPTIQSVHG